MWSPWRRKDLDEAARRERGKLAEAIIQNDRRRLSLERTVRESPASDMLNEMFKQMDEAKHRG